MLMLGIILIVAAAVCIIFGVLSAAAHVLLWIGIVLAVIGVILALVVPRYRSRERL